MKKKNLKSLHLNKKSISNLESHKASGGTCHTLDVRCGIVTISAAICNGQFSICCSKPPLCLHTTGAGQMGPCL